jgi:hypothetical protein
MNDINKVLFYSRKVRISFNESGKLKDKQKYISERFIG